MIVYLITAAVLAIYCVLVTLFSPESGTWMFRIVFWTLGLAAAIVFLWFYARKKREAEAGPAQNLAGEVKALFRQAEARLAQTRMGKRARIDRLPVLIFVGDAAAAKTSVVTNSGTEPLHLAGQIYEENRVVSTPAVNLWLTGETVIAEAGQSLLSDEAAWSSFLREVRPARLPALFGGGEPARAVVVCVSCERFLGQGVDESAIPVAGALRARLGQLSRSLGINIPVHVMFNKLDRISSFLDFARNLSETEVRRILGTAVGAREAHQSGVYAEQESQRLSNAFQGIVGALSEQRLALLAREQLEEKLPNIYEFPRDLGRMRTPIVRFLVELLKPAQLATEPILRGFYFSGVRPVTVGDEESGRRRVPQWLHLPHLFSEVLLPELARAGGSTSASTRLGRRLVWAAAAGLMGLFLILATVSFFGNRTLVSRAVEAARATTSPQRDANGLPTLETLSSLEQLRQSLATVVGFRENGRPLRLRWGLYIGDYMYSPLFRLYFDRFQRTLFSETQASLLNWLRRVPARPGPEDEYQPAYESLMAYLCTTEIPQCSRRSVLSPVFVERWLGDREIDDERLILVQSQFGFYADVLPIENPYSLESDGTTVRHAQNYLAQFGGVDRLYLQLLAAAAGDRVPIRFRELFPRAGSVIVNKKEVNPAFTREGWAYVSQGLQDIGGTAAGNACEVHVLGPAASTPEASDGLRSQLLARYIEDYREEWLEFLNETTVLGYTSPNDAASKLDTMAAVPNSSPLLALLWLVSEHTSGGPPEVAQQFQPAQYVVPPGQEGVYLTDDNRQYMGGLLRLQSAWRSLADDPQGARNQITVGGIRAANSSATETANLLAQGFTGDLSVSRAVRNITLAPIRGSERLLLRLVTPSGESLCTSLSTLQRKYPFNPTASEEATVGDIDAVFHPEFGQLRALLDSLSEEIVYDGSRRAYVARPGGQLNISPQFLEFFNRVAAISGALYPDGSSQIQFAYNITPFPNDALERLELEVDGRVLRSTGRGGSTADFVWPGQGGGVVMRIFPGGFEPQRHNGLWAVTRFLANATGFDTASGTYEWRPETSGQPMVLNGRQVVIRYRVSYPSGVPFLQQGYLSGLSCVSRVTR